MTPVIPSAWRLSATTFNWTMLLLEARALPAEIAAGIASAGIATEIEIEAGQMLRSFPVPERSECEELRGATLAAGACISIVGLSIDDFTSLDHRRSPAEREAFLLPQLHAARHLGAAGIRLPVGQAGPELLKRLQPVLHELGLVLYEEFQGQQTPDRIAAAIDTIARLDDPHVRLLMDTSLLMPALPTTYLETLARSGLDGQLVKRLAEAWLEPKTLSAVQTALRENLVPPAVRTLFMNLLVRFGRSSIGEVLGIMPLVGAIHAKFWDLDDADDRISAPLRSLGEALAGQGFEGTICSEWGGHEWLPDDDPSDTTRRHLALLRTALAAGASAAAPANVLPQL